MRGLGEPGPGGQCGCFQTYGEPVATPDLKRIPAPFSMGNAWKPPGQWWVPVQPLQVAGSASPARGPSVLWRSVSQGRTGLPEQVLGAGPGVSVFIVSISDCHVIGAQQCFWNTFTDIVDVCDFFLQKMSIKQCIQYPVVIFAGGICILAVKNLYRYM